MKLIDYIGLLCYITIIIVCTSFIMFAYVMPFTINPFYYCNMHLSHNYSENDFTIDRDMLKGTLMSLKRQRYETIDLRTPRTLVVGVCQSRDMIGCCAINKTTTSDKYNNIGCFKIIKG